MPLRQNLSLLAIILIYFVQKCTLETEIPTTTTLDDLTTTDLEDLFRPYEAQYPQQNVGEIGEEEEFQNDEKMVGVLEGIDRVIESIEKVVTGLQRQLHDGEEHEGGEIRRQKRIPNEKNMWDVGQLVEKASNQMVILNRLQNMKKKQLQAVEEFMGKKDEVKPTEKPLSPQEKLKEFTLKNLNKTKQEKPTGHTGEPFRGMGAFFNYFAPTSTTTYPPPPQIKNKIVVESDDFYEDDPLDRRVRSTDSHFFSSLASYLMRPFAQEAESTQNPHVKREIDDPNDPLDAHNDLENDVLVTPQQIPEEFNHPKSESPLIESIQAIPDPEVRLEFTKDIQPKIEGLEEAVEEPKRPIHLTVVEEDGTVIELTESPNPKQAEEVKKISSLLDEVLKMQDLVTEEPSKMFPEVETEKKEVSSTISPVVATITEELSDDVTTRSEEYVSERDNEVISREVPEVSGKEKHVEDWKTVQELSKEKNVEEFTESATEFTTLPSYDETTLAVDIREDEEQVLAEDKFEEAVLATTLSPDTESEEKIAAKSSVEEEIEVLGENFATDFPTSFPIVEETTTWINEEEAESTTPASYVEKVNQLKKELEKKPSGSSSSSSSEESSSSSSSSSSTSESNYSTTVRSESLNVNEDSLSKNELYDLLSKPINKPASSESREEDNVVKTTKKEARSRSLDVSQAVIVSQSPEEISAIEDESKPTMDNHAVRKKEGVSREFLQETAEETTTTETPTVHEGRSFSGETVEEAVQSIVDAVDIAMDTKKSIETFPEAVETTEPPPTTDRPLASTKNTRDLVGLGRDDSSLGLEESLPLDRTPVTEDSTAVITSATAAIVAVILVLGVGVYAVLRTRVHGGLDMAAV